MFFLILESIGTSELLLIGLVALIFLGPRKMPEMARKIGKIMAEFRGTANEFKETWQREVDFSEEAKSLDLNALDGDTISRMKDAPVSPSLETGDESETKPADPEITEADPSRFEHLMPKSDDPQPVPTTELPAKIEPHDKTSWL